MEITFFHGDPERRTFEKYFLEFCKCSILECCMIRYSKFHILVAWFLYDFGYVDILNFGMVACSFRESNNLHHKEREQNIKIF